MQLTNILLQPDNITLVFLIAYQNISPHFPGHWNPDNARFGQLASAVSSLFIAVSVAHPSWSNMFSKAAFGGGMKFNLTLINLVYCVMLRFGRRRAGDSKSSLKNSRLGRQGTRTDNVSKRSYKLNRQFHTQPNNKENRRIWPMRLKQKRKEKRKVCGDNKNERGGWWYSNSCDAPTNCRSY